MLQLNLKFLQPRKKLQHIAMQRNDELRTEFMEEFSYLLARMILWLDETGNDRRSDCRKYGYHLRGMTPCNFKLIVKGKRMSAIVIMSERGIEDVDIYDGNIDGDTFGRESGSYSATI